jgi:hypothetical protein
MAILKNVSESSPAAEKRMSSKHIHIIHMSPAGEWRDSSHVTVVLYPLWLTQEPKILRLVVRLITFLLRGEFPILMIGLAARSGFQEILVDFSMGSLPASVKKACLH